MGVLKTKQKPVLFHGKRLSSESFFIRTGKPALGLNNSRAKRLGTRFLSSVWFREATKAKRRALDLPLPSFKQRLHGGKLPKADVVAIQQQTEFALREFAGHLLPAERARAMRQLQQLVSQRILSIGIALMEKTASDLRQMRVQGKELLTQLKAKGEMHIGLMQDASGRVYFAKGWSNKRSERGIALHEAMHVLQKLGVIKVDVPFAEAARWLYGLEKGLFKPNLNIRAPTLAEFDRKALPEKEYPALLYEAQWSYALGDRIGQWVYKNLSGKDRWDYLRLRCNGKTHLEALNSIGRKALEKVA